MAKARPKQDTVKTEEPLDLGTDQEDTSKPVRDDRNIEDMLDAAENEDELIAQLDRPPEPGPDVPREVKLEDDVKWVVFDWGGEDITFPIRKEYVFGAVATRYRLQLISKRDIIDQSTGQIQPGRNVAAQFDDSIYHTKNEAIARLVYRSKSFQQGLIWDVMSMAAQAKEANFNALKKLVGTDPKNEERLYEELRQKYEESQSATA